MDFDSPSAAQKAVMALKASGVQAQMAKVRALPHVFSPRGLWLATKVQLVPWFPEGLTTMKSMGKGQLQCSLTVSGQSKSGLGTHSAALGC